MRTRIIVGTLLLATLGLACWIDIELERPYVSSALILILGVAALREWNRFFGDEPGRPEPAGERQVSFGREGKTYPGLLYTAGIAYPVLEGWRQISEGRWASFDFLFLAAFLIALYVRAVLAGHVKDGVDRIARTLLGFLTVWLFYRLVPILLSKEGGLGAAYGLVITSKSCDIGAYLSGSLFGKRKLIPRVSPGKTVAGAVGGLALSMGVGVLAFSVPGAESYLFGVVFGLVVGGATMFGDLAESVVKRCAGVKDSGDVFPGAGGVFDLIDSLILAAPAGYVLLILL